jgi:hypothetical protein
MNKKDHVFLQGKTRWKLWFSDNLGTKVEILKRQLYSDSTQERWQDADFSESHVENFTFRVHWRLRISCCLLHIFMSHIHFLGTKSKKPCVACVATSFFVYSKDDETLTFENCMLHAAYTFHMLHAAYTYSYLDIHIHIFQYAYSYFSYAYSYLCCIYIFIFLMLHAAYTFHIFGHTEQKAMHRLCGDEFLLDVDAALRSQVCNVTKL